MKKVWRKGLGRRLPQRLMCGTFRSFVQHFRSKVRDFQRTAGAVRSDRGRDAMAFSDSGTGKQGLETFKCLRQFLMALLLEKYEDFPLE